METHTYHDISGLDILAAARNGGYLVWDGEGVAWRAGRPIRDPQTLAWHLVAEDGTHEIVAAGVQLARAILGPHPEMWDTMALACAHRIIAVVRTPAARDYVWTDTAMAAVVYPDGADVYGPYTRHAREVWHTMPDDVA